jgi:hypothetical protein
VRIDVGFGALAEGHRLGRVELGVCPVALARVNWIEAAQPQLAAFGGVFARSAYIVIR